MVKWNLEKAESKKTKKFTRVRWMWGILTFFVPSQISTSLGFLKFFGASYGLDVAWIGPLHLQSGQMISGEIEIEKYSKIHKGRKNVRNPHILRTLPNLHLFGLFKIFRGMIWLGCCLNRSITLRSWSNDIRKNRNRKILKNSSGYEECEESSHSSYPPNSPLRWAF